MTADRLYIEVGSKTWGMMCDRNISADSIRRRIKILEIKPEEVTGIEIYTGWGILIRRYESYGELDKRADTHFYM